MDHPPSAVVEHERGACAASYGLEGPCGVEAKRLGQGQRLGSRGDVDPAEHLVNHLHGLTLPRVGTHLDDVTERVEQGAGHGVQPRGHHEQAAVAGAHDAPAHRRVNNAGTRRDTAGQLFDPGRPHRREHHDAGPRIEGLERPTTDQGLIGLLGGGHHDDEDLRTPGSVRRVGGGVVGTGRVEALAVWVVGADPVARGNDPLHHR